MLRKIARRFLFLFVSIGVASTAAAQSSNATLHGTIVDSGGGELPGVIVKLQAAEDRHRPTAPDAAAAAPIHVLRCASLSDDLHRVVLRGCHAAVLISAA
jgi:hypothetical protein